ncbi:site-specific integrase [Agrobacterium sp. Ap1]|uniref:site-specific integrase n=1 Tax=Agrobacterium sp. Ap1 TaxID=2815337 RepID=UPI001A8FA803|nr:site-specific integrase [Agrobacterium sp. Ap1]MBO0141606.1 site-specific integrase [Agrobacterium sp. Ap1]
MTKKTTRKLPQYLQELNGRYFARVPIKEELRPYIGGTQLREPLGPDLRTAKENLFYHVAVFKERIRKAAEEYERDTGKSLALTTEPVDPSKLMVRHYRDIVSHDQSMRDAGSLYATSGAVDDMLVSYLRDGMSGRLTDDQYYSIIANSLEDMKVRFAPNARPGAEGFRELARLMCVAQYEGLSRIAERDDGIMTGEPEHPALIDAIEQDKTEQTADVEIREFDHWTFDAVIDEQERRAAMGLGRAKSEATLEKYRVAQYDFEHFRKHKKVATITLADGKAWRDHMLNKGKLSRKSIKDKITIIRTLMNWANMQAEKQMFPAGDPWAALELPNVEKADSAERTYSLKDARHFLEFARTASRTSFRWIPWIIAHTGARVNEITVLEKRDVSEVEGHWFIHIRVGDGRTTKTHKARKVPVHRALIAEGFIEWVKAQPEGKLFPGGKNEDQRLREWIHEKVFPNRNDLPPPNHGFRHLFEDALFGGVSHKAALYITGRSSGSSADDYGGSDYRLIEIAEQMDKVRNILAHKRGVSE